MGRIFSKYAQVAVDAPLFKLFTYGIPEEFLKLTAPGWRVLVPFRNRLISGFVIKITRQPSIKLDLIKPIIDVPDDDPIFSPNLLKLCKFVSEYYVAPLGETLANVLPPGVGVNTKQVISMCGVPDVDILNNNQRRIIRLLTGKTLQLSKILEKIGHKGTMHNLKNLERMGLIERKYIYKFQAPPKTVDVAVASLDVTDEVIKNLENHAPKQTSVMRYLLQDGKTKLSVLRKLFGASAVKACIDKGYIHIEKKEIFRSSGGWLTPRKEISEFTLSQKKAIKEISKAFESGGKKPFLIHGVTGSGKTLVYLEAARMVRSLGKGVLVLVPEVALTPQMWGAMRDFFGEEVAVLHSYLSPGERADAWRKLQKGGIKIALGARSAIFAPITDTGLIVVDEEQDSSYKQARIPYYNARDLAIIRGRIENALVILGSATPSIESYYNTKIGKYHLIEMPERVPGAKLPKVHIVDIRKLRKDERILSRVVVDETKKRMDAGEQTIFLLNRRGFSTSLECDECGYVPRCPHCELTLTYHRVGDELKCHWCDYRTPAPENCPGCNAENFKHRGKGTQKIELELYKFVDSQRIFRIDSDAISQKGALRKLLEGFAAKEGAVIVGTQMVAKGHDFPNVTLVAVVDADIGLGVPDVRSSERTFQLLSQVAGRAGRGEKPGLVIIQTRHPESLTIKCAVNHDFKTFYDSIIIERQRLQYPPASHLVRILTQSKDSNLAEKALRIIHDELILRKIDGVIPLSPTKPPLAKLRDKYRWHMLIKSLNIKLLLPFLHSVPQTEFKNVKIKIDVDPLDLM